MLGLLSLPGPSPAIAKQPSNSEQLVENNLPGKKPLHKRIGGMPSHVLEFMRERDNRDDYEAYEPSLDELKLIAHYFKQLPDSYLRLLNEKVVGIYFIEDFHGNGFTQRMVTSRGQFYFLVFDIRTLKNAAYELAGWRALSLFRNRQVLNSWREHGEGPLYVNLGGEYHGFLWMLLHELSHVYDFENEVSMSGEGLPGAPKTFSDTETSFTRGVWNGTQPRTAHDFPLREELHFYGLESDTRLALSRLTDVLNQLRGTSFVSLYGAQNPREDFADFMTYYHWTQELGEPYVIKGRVDGEEVFRYEPMASDTVSRRFDRRFLRDIYR